MCEILIVRAIVPEHLKDQFETWYDNEHLPEAHKAFGSCEAYRGWSSDNPEAHFAVYRFINIGAVHEITENHILGRLVAKFDERWQGYVTRTREVIVENQNLKGNLTND